MPLFVIPLSNIRQPSIAETRLFFSRTTRRFQEAEKATQGSSPAPKTGRQAFRYAQTSSCRTSPHTFDAVTPDA